MSLIGRIDFLTTLNLCRRIQPFLSYCNLESVICAAYTRLHLTFFWIYDRMKFEQTKICITLSEIQGLRNSKFESHRASKLNFSCTSGKFWAVRESLTIMSIYDFQFFSSFDGKYFTQWNLFEIAPLSTFNNFSWCIAWWDTLSFVPFLRRPSDSTWLSRIPNQSENLPLLGSGIPTWKIRNVDLHCAKVNSCSILFLLAPLDQKLLNLIAWIRFIWTL